MSIRLRGIVPRHRPTRAAQSARPVVITIVGAGYPVAALAAHLPPRWRIRHLRAVSGLVAPDAIVLTCATPRVVRQARAGYPAVVLVALLQTVTPATVIAELLDAGADVCIRADRPQLLAEYLLDHLRPDGVPPPDADARVPLPA